MELVYYARVQYLPGNSWNCPAEFDIGELAKVAVLSVTEGEEKPLKYPLLFTEAQAVVLTKIDLLPHLSFDMDTCLEYIHQINAHIAIYQVSPLNNLGMEKFISWLTGLKWKNEFMQQLTVAFRESDSYQRYRVL